ncbi:MAG: SulP family inorganic anion transporter, partial [Desulfobacterales bacterium]
TPVITGLYTILIPMALFAVFGSSRHLVVGADSATAAILAAGLVGIAATGSDEYVALANVGAGLSGTFVVNGSPTKTQMVDSAGGRTQLSLMVTTVIVLLVLLFLTAPLAHMPEAVLSAVVFLIGVDLIDLKGIRKIFSQRRSEFWVALITALMVVFVGVEQGILLAIVLSLIDHTRRGYRPKNAVLVPAESGAWRAQPVATKAQAVPGLLIYRFTHSMYYANSQQLSEEILDLVNSAEPPLRWFCLDAAAVGSTCQTAWPKRKQLRG